MTPISSCVKNNKIEDRWLRMIRTTIKSKPLGLVLLKEAIALPQPLPMERRRAKQLFSVPKVKRYDSWFIVNIKHSYQLHTFSTHR